MLGLRESSWLRISDDGSAQLGGAKAARLFGRGSEPRELPSGSDVSFLLDSKPAFDAG